MAITPPRASAVYQSIFHHTGNSQSSMSEPIVASTMVRPTCEKPSPKTSLCIARSLGRLNSSPMTNIRKTTPNSAR